MNFLRMRKQNTLLLVLALGICSVTSLVDRFFVNLPVWLVIILMVVAGGLLLYYVILLRKNKLKQPAKEH